MQKSVKSTTQNILSLDDQKTLDKEQFVYIKHIKSDKVYDIPYTAAIHSRFLKESVINNIDDIYGKTENNPLIIPDTVKFDTIELIVNYMKFYDNKSEKTAPEAPLRDIHISVILGDEYKLYEHLYPNDKNINCIKNTILYINDYIICAMYFNFQYLHKKLAALVASILTNLSDDEIKQLSQLNN